MIQSYTFVFLKHGYLEICDFYYMTAFDDSFVDWYIGLKKKNNFTAAKIDMSMSQ